MTSYFIIGSSIWEVDVGVLRGRDTSLVALSMDCSTLLLPAGCLLRRYLTSMWLEVDQGSVLRFAVSGCMLLQWVQTPIGAKLEPLLTNKQ